MSAVRRWTWPMRTPGSMGFGAASRGTIEPCGPVVSEEVMAEGSRASGRAPMGIPRRCMDFRAEGDPRHNRGDVGDVLHDSRGKRDPRHGGMDVGHLLQAAARF